MERINLFEGWLRASGKSEHTITSYVACLKRFLEFIDKPPEEAGALDVISWYNRLREEGYSESSLALYGWGLRNFYKAMGKFNIANSIPVPSYEVKEAKWLEKPTIFKIIEMPSSIVRRAMLGVSYELALRIGETVLLQRDGFDPNEKTMRVRRLKRRSVAPITKLPVSNWCCEILNTYLKEQNNNVKNLLPFHKSTIQRTFRKYANLCNIDPEYTFHTLRHSRLTHMAIDMLRDQRRINAFRLMVFAGHSQISTTMNYIHLAAKYLKVDLTSIEGWEDIEAFETRRGTRFKGA